MYAGRRGIGAVSAASGTAPRTAGTFNVYWGDPSGKPCDGTDPVTCSQYYDALAHPYFAARRFT